MTERRLGDRRALLSGYRNASKALVFKVWQRLFVRGYVEKAVYFEPVWSGSEDSLAAIVLGSSSAVAVRSAIN